MTAPRRDVLFERDAELTRLTVGRLAAAAGDGSVIIVEGSAGAGKTALLRALRQEPGGARVLTAAAGEFEREFAFGVVRQLFEPVVLAAAPEERERLLSGAAALAGAVVGAAPDDAGGGEAGFDVSFAVLHGLYWLVAALAEAGPLTLVVDDAHWADPPSLRFLEFLARRVQELPVFVVIGTRPHEPGAELELLGALADTAEVLRPAPLTPAAVEQIVQAELGDTSADVITGASTATNGNPLLLRELVRDLARSGLPATAAAVRDAVPSSVTRSVTRRLARLPESARTVATTVAVLGDGQPQAALTAMTGLSRAALGAALADLRAVELLEGEPPAFVHPLLRQATAETLTPGERDELHHRLARRLHDEGRDADAVVHLLAAAPLGEPWVIDVLRADADRALSEGAPDLAARRLRRALEEAPDGDDTLLLALAMVEGRVGDPRAIEHLAELAGAADPEVAGTALAARVGMGFVYDPDQIRAAVDSTRELLGRVESPAVLGELRLQMLQALTLSPALSAERAAFLDEIDQDTPEVATMRAFDAAAGRGTQAEVLAFAQRALAGRPMTHLNGVEQPGVSAWAMVALNDMDAPDLALATTADGLATAQRTGSRFARAMSAYMRLELTIETGPYPSAEAEVRDVLEILGTANAATLPAAGAQLGAILTRIGRLEEADAVFAGLPPDHESDQLLAGGIVRGDRLELRIAQGRFADAIADGRALRAYSARYGFERFPRATWTPKFALALILAGEVEEGREIAEAEVTSGRARGVPKQEARALIALGHALEGEPSLEAFAAAAEVAGRSTAVFLQAHAAFEFGAALRRANRRADARARLSAARDLAHRIGAERLLELATTELSVAGGRPRRIALSGADALSPSERRVAEHAASGMTNRQIAETLFVTRKTVEFQLGAAYTKLGIRGRGELPAALAVPRTDE